MEARVGFRDTFGLLAVQSGEESADTLGEGGRNRPGSGSKRVEGVAGWKIALKRCISVTSVEVNDEAGPDVPFEFLLRPWPLPMRSKRPSRRRDTVPFT